MPDIEQLWGNPLEENIVPVGGYHSIHLYHNFRNTEEIQDAHPDIHGYPWQESRDLWIDWANNNLLNQNGVPYVIGALRAYYNCIRATQIHEMNLNDLNIFIEENEDQQLYQPGEFFHRYLCNFKLLNFEDIPRFIKCIYSAGCLWHEGTNNPPAVRSERLIEQQLAGGVNASNTLYQVGTYMGRHLQLLNQDNSITDLFIQYFDEDYCECIKGGPKYPPSETSSQPSRPKPPNTPHKTASSSASKEPNEDCEEVAADHFTNQQQLNESIIETRPIVPPQGIVLKAGVTTAMEDALFSVNSEGVSPHIALFGRNASGKTRTGWQLIKQILNSTSIPLFLFDPKGDFRPGGNYHQRLLDYGEEVHPKIRCITVGSDPIPLDFLAHSDAEEPKQRAYADQLASLICSFARNLGITSKSRLQNVLLTVSSEQEPENRSLPAIKDSYEQALERDGKKTDQDQILRILDDLTFHNMFEPRLNAENFFNQSWILSASGDLPPERITQVAQIILRAFTTWILGKGDSTIKDGNRNLRNLLVVDEAQQFLKAKDATALKDFFRKSRSKGGMGILLSQSPSDFSGVDQEFLEQIPNIIGFVSNIRSRQLRELAGAFGRSVTAFDFSEQRLPKGHAFCKLSGRAPDVIKCW